MHTGNYRLSFCFLLMGAIAFAEVQQGKDETAKVIRALNHAVSAGNIELLESSARTLVTANSRAAADALIRAARIAPLTQYWKLLDHISRMSSPEATGAVIDEVVNGKIPELQRDLIACFRPRALSRPQEALGEILEKASVPLKSIALEELTSLGDASVLQILIGQAEKHKDSAPEFTRRIKKALRAILGTSPEGPPENWRAWLSQQQPSIQSGAIEPPKRSRTTVVETLDKFRISDFHDIKQEKPDLILVVEGASDSVQDTLVRLDIPHSRTKWENIQRGEDLVFGKYTAIFVNCGTGDWPPPQAQRMRKYVSDGGYLLVTDIGVTQVVRPSFPGIYEPGKGSQNDAAPEIVPARGSTGHPMLRGIEQPLSNLDQNVKKPAYRWNIESSGPVFSFDPKRVVSLIEAPELALKKKFGSVAVTFNYGGNEEQMQQAVATGGVYEEFSQMGGGKVICMLSHFSKQTQQDGFAIENLLINFIIEARDRRLMREDEKKAPPKKRK